MKANQKIALIGSLAIAALIWRKIVEKHRAYNPQNEITPNYGVGELDNPFTPKKIYGIKVKQADGHDWVDYNLFAHAIDAHRYLKQNIKTDLFNIEFIKPYGSNGWYEITKKDTGKHFADIFINEFYYYE